MAHHGMLRDFRFSSDVDDVRGTNLYGTDDDKLGKIDDVIFDHATGVIEYAVVDTGGWLSSKKFLVPAERIYPYAKNDDDFAIDASKQQIEALPKYDEDAVKDDAAWTGYDKQYREAWGGGPVMHKEGSTHTITPEASQMPAGTGSGAGDEALMPDRLAGKYPSTSPDPSKLRMRPASAAKAEDTRLPGQFIPEDKPTGASEPAEKSADAYQQFDELGKVNPIEEQRTT
jgi:sporulation protein YlmC with PRC-barrel domain